MTEIPQPINSIQSLIDEHHFSINEKPRVHLGASVLGHPCQRWLWLSFRWAIIEKFPGRIRRVFRRGLNEETIIVNDLKAIGIKIEKTGREQTIINFGFHIGGSVDGIIESGVPEAPNKKHIAEFKTHSKKSFDDLEKKGVQESKPQHWCQMQLYMKGTGIDRALYVGICKDDDRIYTERVRYDAEAAETLLERGKKIALSERIPDPVSTDPSWYQCKFCAAHDFCHSRRLTQEVNCRTCAHSTPEADGTWSCARWESKDIPANFQIEGCASHVLHPDMVPWPMKLSNTPHEAVYEIDGVDVRNGEGDAFTFSSRELIVGGEACSASIVSKIKRDFPGAKIEAVNNVEDTI